MRANRHYGLEYKGGLFLPQASCFVQREHPSISDPGLSVLSHIAARYDPPQQIPSLRSLSYLCYFDALLVSVSLMLKKRTAGPPNVN